MGNRSPTTRLPPRIPKAATRSGATADPAATPAWCSPSSTPNTRARIGSGTMRWRRVRPVMSARACPDPAPTRIAKAITATTASERADIPNP